MRSTLFALILLVFAAPAFAQLPVSQFVSADDESVAFLVRYIGASDSATMEVAIGADITFQVDAVAYTGFECPIAGGLGGIIDTTDNACDTIGEVIDAINGNCAGCVSEFRAVAVDALGSDSADDLLTAAALQTTRIDGLPANFDTSNNFAVGEGRALIPNSCRTDISCFLSQQGNLLENPFASNQTVIGWVEGLNTFGSGSSVLTIHSVKVSNKIATTEDVTTLWSEAMGATTVNKQFTQFQNVPVLGGYGEKVIVKIVNSASQTLVTLLVSAQQRPNP